MGGSSKELTPEQALAVAKAQFNQAANAINPWDVITDRPLTSLGCAFALGFGLNYFRRPAKAQSLLPVIGQICTLLTHFIPLYSRARSSGG